MALRRRASARLVLALASILVTAALVCPLGGGGAGHAATLTPAQALKEAAKHDRLARRFDKLGKRERKQARKTAKEAAKVRRKPLRKIRARQSVPTRALRRMHLLKRQVRGHKRKAKQYAAKAR